jgi:hypothetical protein
VFFVDEVERGGVRANHEVPTGIVETERAGAQVARRGPQFFRGESEVTKAPAGAKAFAQEEATHLFEGVAQGVPVDAEAKTDSGASHRTQIGQAVTEIALGGRARADEGLGLTEELGFAPGDVDGVHGHEALRQQTVVSQELEGTPLGFGETELDFLRLFGNVHVDRQAASSGPSSDGFELFGRHGPHAVGRDPDAYIGIAAVAGKKRLDVLQPVLEGRIAESALGSFGGSSRTRAPINDAKQGDA